MEGRTAAKIFISLGLLAGFLGFLIGNFFLNFAVFTVARIIAINIIIIGISIGFNWIVVGVVLALAKREVGEGGFLSCLFFGITGVILWLLICLSRESASRLDRVYNSRKNYQRSSSGEGSKCGSCYWFGKEECERKEELINARLCANFMDSSDKLYS